MASTILVKDALWRISVALNDVSPQFTFWTENELVQWMNDAQAEIAKFMPSSCSRVDAIKLHAGTRQSIDKILAAECKPGDGSTPSSPIYGKTLIGVTRNMGADGATPGNAVRLVDREVKDALNPAWHTVAGDGTVDAYMYDPRTPKVFYVSKQATTAPATWVEIAYTAQPLPIDNSGTAGAERYLHSTSSATDLITIDDQYIAEIVSWVAARAHMKISKFSDPSKAIAFTGMFTNSLNAAVTAQTGSNPRLVTLPGV